MKRRKKGLFWIISGLLLIAVGAGITGYYEYTEYHAVKISAGVLEELDLIQKKALEAKKEGNAADPQTEAEIVGPGAETSENIENSTNTGTSSTSGTGYAGNAEGYYSSSGKYSPSMNKVLPFIPMPIVTIEGMDYIGIIEIPSLGIRLPVMSDFDDQKLNMSACRYFGSYYQDNLIICAHRWAEFFGNLNELRPGQYVKFTDIDGNEFNYVVTLWDLVPSTEEGEMVSGEWDLTLFTCADVDLKERITIRCKKI